MAPPFPQAISVAELCGYLGGEADDAVRIDGAGHTVLRGVAPLASAGPEDLAFLGDFRYRQELAGTRAGAILLGEPDARAARSAGARSTLLITAFPQRAFARALRALYPEVYPDAGLARAAAPTVHPSAQLAESARVGPYCVISQGANIGPGTVLYGLCYVGPGVVIGADCRIHPFVTLHHGARLGDRVIVHPASVISSDGFGLTAGSSGPEKMPQVGGVLIGDDVEIGAGVTIDRGALEDTRIGSGCKLDNQVHIGHNVALGQKCVLVAQVGISGSTTLGEGVTMGGQSGAAGHLHIGSGATIAARGGVINHLDGNGLYGGFPALPVREWRRITAATHRLSDALVELRRLRQRVAALEERLGESASEPPEV
ncbi:MAG: UDP-3-O-(3-hydroxymyristoyl)glucosamine N-acyltransferase [Candidatus Schekmanbacteria bacterium]|nr:UDP-3-O-(3-hydroxymyristoyl)glucosamine N-acyltransferase [Candidatus Schekmanbacteria bacterium]